MIGIFLAQCCFGKPSIRTPIHNYLEFYHVPKRYISAKRRWDLKSMPERDATYDSTRVVVSVE